MKFVWETTIKFGHTKLNNRLINHAEMPYN